MKSRTKLIQNMALAAAMATGFGVIIVDELRNVSTGIILISIAAIISCVILLIKKRNLSTYLVVFMWLAIPLSFLVGFFGMFGSSLDNFINWAKVSFIVGAMAAILTTIQLFRRN